MTTPVRLAAGRTAQVFAIDDGRVLRRYMGGQDATAEAALMSWAHAQGYPVPAVFSAHGPDIVMERVDGPTMLDMLLDGRLDPAGGGQTLGRLLNQLHAVPPGPSCPPDERLIHLDLHPGNVMIAKNGPVVIDWCNARNGLPDLDLAVSALIMGEVMAGGHPMTDGIREMLARLLQTAGGRPEDQLDAAVQMRAADPFLEPEEKARLDQAASLVRECLSDRRT